MKQIFSLFLLLSLFSLKSFAQPTDDPMNDPGGGLTYDAGYIGGAIEGSTFKQLLADGYNCEVQWYSYNPSAYKHRGVPVDFDAPGLKIPVLVWADFPPQELFEIREVFERIGELQLHAPLHDYDSGYYSGFMDYFYD